MHSLINCIGNTINLGCASKHLIKYLKPWLIKRGCTNHLSFLLFDFILILHFAPLLMHLLPTWMHPQNLCIQLFCKIFSICFFKKASNCTPKSFVHKYLYKLKLCICPQLAYIFLKS